MTIDGSKHINDITSFHSQYHHGLTDRRPITSRHNSSIKSITRVKYHQLAWYNSLWLWRWLPNRLSKHQSLSKKTVLFRTTFNWTIILNLLLYLLTVNLYTLLLYHFYISVIPLETFRTNTKKASRWWALPSILVGKQRRTRTGYCEMYCLAKFLPQVGTLLVWK